MKFLNKKNRCCAMWVAAYAHCLYEGRSISMLPPEIYPRQMVLV